MSPKSKEAAIRAQKERDIFAQNFRRLLEAKGKTQADIVAALDITSSTVSDWANAKKYPRIDKMQLIADHLGVLVSELRDEHNAATQARQAFSHRMQRLAELFEELNDDGQEKLIEYATDLVSSGRYKKHVAPDRIQKNA